MGEMIETCPRCGGPTRWNGDHIGGACTAPVTEPSDDGEPYPGWRQEREGNWTEPSDEACDCGGRPYEIGGAEHRVGCGTEPSDDAALAELWLAIHAPGCLGLLPDGKQRCACHLRYGGRDADAARAVLASDWLVADRQRVAREAVSEALAEVGIAGTPENLAALTTALKPWACCGYPQGCGATCQDDPLSAALARAAQEVASEAAARERAGQ